LSFSAYIKRTKAGIIKQFQVAGKREGKRKTRKETLRKDNNEVKSKKLGLGKSRKNNESS
jgi:hypothetical protein